MQTANRSGWLNRLNTRWHKVAMWFFTFVVVAHWAEHLVQAFQIYALHWARPHALGVLGLAYPVLVHSEWLHYLYAIVMLAGFIMLRPAFVGRGRIWWDIALWIQVWHHFEHFLLLVQALTGHNLFGGAAPTSLIQLVMPRVELHLVYNALVTVPMAFGAYFHTCPPAGEEAPACSCSRHHKTAAHG